MTSQVFWTIAPVDPVNHGFSWLPMMDSKPADSDDASQIALAITQVEMDGQDKFVITPANGNDKLSVVVREDNFIDAVRVFVTALTTHTLNIVAKQANQEPEVRVYNVMSDEPLPEDMPPEVRRLVETIKADMAGSNIDRMAEEAGLKPLPRSKKLFRN